KLKKTQRGRLARTVAKARTRDSLQALGKLATTTDGGECHIRSVPPLVIPIGDLLPEPEQAEVSTRIREILDGYASTLTPDLRKLLGTYRLVDIAHKVVGVGSVGTRAWIILMLGRDLSDPLFLQAKEAQASVLEGLAGPGEFGNQGERVVAGQ